MSRQVTQPDVSEGYSIAHYPIFRDPSAPVLFFPAHSFQNEVYSDEEQELNLALYMALLSARHLSAEHRASDGGDNGVTGVSGPEKEGGEEENATSPEAKKGKRRSFWAHLNHRYEANLLQRKSLNEVLNNSAEPCVKSTQHAPVETTITTTGPTSHELLQRETRREMREAKWSQMRTNRPIDGDLEAKFAQLRTDAPEPESLQLNTAWAHEQLRLANEARIRDKALAFKYRLRMSLNAGAPAGWKSCLAGRGGEKEWEEEKVVRFDDVHAAKKVRWVDVEHVAELAQTQYETWRNAF